MTSAALVMVRFSRTSHAFVDARDERGWSAFADHDERRREMVEEVLV